MLRTFDEWYEFVFDRGTDGSMVFDILKDWKEREGSFLYTTKCWREDKEDWCQREDKLLAEVQRIERAVYEFFCEVTYDSDLTYVGTLESIAWLRWDHKVWCKHSLTDLCERVQLLTDENRMLRGEEAPYWKEGEKKPCRFQQQEKKKL